MVLELLPLRDKKFKTRSQSRILVPLMHLSMLSRWGGGGKPGIGGGFDSSHCLVVGTFDRFNGLSSNILLTCSCYFDNPQMP